uniref:Uncharacterized protein n=1 Tax=Candidatus Kentrum sp. SD TaxID=2126332 RepID=A0A450YVU0_9GAMM|nr:MAG: hypothetical protein BECKSD772F_GA0070984_10633 [Candidatus Kentron sp. SD]VFK45646.1 MAG: hypothetical protein BECKSD772E_GA0070983_10583 [Candidatus Kentron sp. SD]
MLENDIFEQWLNTEGDRVLAKLRNSESITQDDKLIILLKGQMNHIQHLDVDLRQGMIALGQDMDRRDVDLRQEMIALRQDMDRRDVDLRQEMITLRQDMDRRFEQVDRRFEQSDRRFESINEEIRQVYRAINAQTWKMIGAVGAIVLLGRLIE